MPSPLPIDPADLDGSVKPTNDFFRFVNGNWMKNNPIPPEEARWGSFIVLRVIVEKQLKAILDELVASAPGSLGSVAQKVRDLYTVAIDTEKVNRLGIAPLSDIFASIDAVQNLDDLVRLVGSLQRQGISAWWTPAALQDEKNTEVVAFTLYQGGLGLPDRDYYLNDDEKSRDIRAKYISYMQNTFVSFGTLPANVEKISSSVMEIEAQLARASRTPVQLRDPEKNYNKTPFEGLNILAPHINWVRYCQGIMVAPPAYAIVGQPEFFAQADRLFESLSLEAHKDYLRWHVMNDLAGYLSEPLERARFDFYGPTFSGTKEMKARWRRALGVLNNLLDEAVAQLYVEKHFSPEAKRKVTDLVDHLTVALRARIEKLEWMSAETKEKALIKLAGFSKKLGYPNKWKDISGMKVAGTASYAENAIHAHEFEFDRLMKKIGQPVDRGEWYMSPQTVNACYQPTMNEILFPAAILQPPFFDPNADDAVNFGGIGSVIGHELTHGFDDQGGLYDEKGNLKNWWTEADKKSFDKRAAQLAEQFDTYEPLPGLHVNGKLTLGENIADLGGLLIAYDAMEIAFKEKAGPATTIDGLTPYQRFFISYAITERGHARDAYLRLLVQTDPHAPGEYRVNGPMSNLDIFYEAFRCEMGDGLWRSPEDRVKIW